MAREPLGSPPRAAHCCRPNGDKPWSGTRWRPPARCKSTGCQRRPARGRLRVGLTGEGLAGAAYGEFPPERSTPATASATGSGRPAPARSRSRSRSSARGAAARLPGAAAAGGVGADRGVPGGLLPGQVHPLGRRDGAGQGHARQLPEPSLAAGQGDRRQGPGLPLAAAGRRLVGSRLDAAEVKIAGSGAASRSRWRSTTSAAAPRPAWRSAPRRPRPSGPRSCARWPGVGSGGQLAGLRRPPEAAGAAVMCVLGALGQRCRMHCMRNLTRIGSGTISGAPYCIRVGSLSCQASPEALERPFQ